MEHNPTWYKDALIYELHVRSFFDSSDDGIGDFRGLTEKLDYLQDLGVTALWLLPFYPSPLKDDGYDIADYTAINRDYGTMEDFDRFLEAAHDRGLRVITELVINHTSDQHPWFRRARTSPPGSPERNFYMWSDTPERYADARIIFQDFETSNWAWDRTAEAYYWHRFYSHQPDLNFDNVAVQDAVIEVLDFWLDKGVDGLRLDAVPYLYAREGTNCENLPETHQFLKKLRSHVDANYADRMLLAEANQWPEDAAAYFGEGEGDECHMNFHFPLMPRLYLATERGDRFPIVDILEQTPEIPATSQWATFLRNHDELTLEMVTDEERDYMYRAFAQHQKARINLGIRRRLSPLMGNDRRKVELLNALLFSLPGTPVLYYGDEIGMGDNFFLGDRNGVRTPMQWSGDRNAGFSKANPQQLFLPIIADPEYHYEAINVETQQQNPNSLLWFTKRMLALRKRHPVLGRGQIRFLHPDNRKILAFLRFDDHETILVVANLSRHPQYFELDLSEHLGEQPQELFGQSKFPRISEAPYSLSLGPHSMFWFKLREAREHAHTVADSDRTLPRLTLEGADPWGALLRGPGRRQLQDLIAGSLHEQRWFRAKSDVIQSVDLHEAIRVDHGGRHPSYLMLFDVRMTYRGAETYVLPLALVSGEEIDRLPVSRAVAYARVHVPDAGFDGLLVDAMFYPQFSHRMLSLVRLGDTLGEGDLVIRGEAMGPDPADATMDALLPRVLSAEQTNTSVAFETQWVMKIYRKLDSGLNPEVEISRFLTLRGFEHSPRLAGVVSLMRDREIVSSAAVLHDYIENEGDAWEYTLDELEFFFERLLSGEVTKRLSGEQAVGPYLDDARQLGERTAQLHRTLAQGNDAAFQPEPFSSHYQRSVYQSLRNLCGTVFDSLRRAVADKQMPDHHRELCLAVLDAREAITHRFSLISTKKLETLRIRIHGDLHLGQFLRTGRDFLITDYEGEPARPFSERRIKRSALRDVAGMIRSFHYATHACFDRLRHQGLISESNPRPELEDAARAWAMVSVRGYLDAYLREIRADDHPIVPQDSADLRRMLEVFVLGKAVYELGYELDNRPTLVYIPATDILRLLSEGTF